jgi:hypothetical protein
MAGVLNQDWRTELALMVPDFFVARPGRPACAIECGEG